VIWEDVEDWLAFRAGRAAAVRKQIGDISKRKLKGKTYEQQLAERVDRLTNIIIITGLEWQTRRSE